MRWVRTALPSLRLRAPYKRRVNTACGCCWSARKPWSRRNWIATRAAARLPIEIVHASEFITMEDKVEAIRAKRDSSMRVGLRMVREGQAAGFVTAGNTGAAMATAKVVLGAVPGVDRPALAAVFPTAPGNPAMLLDVGANVDCTPQNLEQFAVMGDIYFRAMFGKTAGTAGPASDCFPSAKKRARGTNLRANRSSCSSSFR